MCVCVCCEHWVVNIEYEIGSFAFLFIVQCHNLLLEKSIVWFPSFPLHSYVQWCFTHWRKYKSDIRAINFISYDDDGINKSDGRGILFSSGSKSNNNYLLILVDGLLFLIPSLFTFVSFFSCHNSSNNNIHWEFFT